MRRWLKPWLRHQTDEIDERPFTPVTIQTGKIRGNKGWRSVGENIQASVLLECFGPPPLSHLELAHNGAASFFSYPVSLDVSL